MLAVMNEDGVFEEYDDEFDVVIHCTSQEERDEVLEKLNAPQPKMGHWEWNQYDANPKIGNFHCSLCHSIGRTYFDYCPYCGTKMSEIPTGAEGGDKE